MSTANTSLSHGANPADVFASAWQRIASVLFNGPQVSREAETPLVATAMSAERLRDIGLDIRATATAHERPVRFDAV